MKIFIIVMVLCSYKFIAAQDYNSTIYNYNDKNTIFTESLWFNDTLIISGSGHSDKGGTGVIFKIYKDGNLFYTNTLTDSISNFDSGFWDKGLLKDGDTIYHIAIKGYYNGNYNGLILKLDENGNIIQENEFMSYYYPNDNFTRFRDFKKLNDGFVILDYARKSITDFQPCLIKVDNNFNQVWRKCYGDSFLEIPYDLEILKDGSIVIIGNSTNIDDYYVGSGHGFVKGFIMLFDSLGNKKWEWRSESKKEAVYASCVVDDSLLIIAAGAGKEFCSDSQLDAHCWLRWTGKAFQFNLKTKQKTWETSLSAGDYTNMSDNNYIDIIPSMDGDGFILCGAGFYKIPDCRTDTIDKCWANPGVIAKISSEGDSLWLRKYFGVMDIYESNILYDVEITPDSGYSFVGEAFNPWPGPTQGQHGWLLKTDKYGCLIPGCQLSTSISDESSMGKKDIIQIYPNPATDFINIIINKNVSPNIRIALVNILGETMASYSNIEFGSNYLIQTANLQSGVYIINVVENNAIIDSKKVIIL